MKVQLRNFIIENYLFGQNVDFSDDDSLQDRGIIDSTGVLELVSHLEHTYGVTIADSELVPEYLDSINRIACFIEGKLRTAAAPAPGAGMAAGTGAA